MPAIRYVALIAGLVLLGACAVQPGNAPPAKLALVIGNAAYENAPPLANPVNDANDMCDALRRLGFTTMCHSDVVDRSQFDAHVRRYVEQLAPTSVGVVYYSGHGVQAGGANYLIPTKVQPRGVAEDPTRVLYGVDELFDRLRARPTRFQLVILDACRSDLFGTPRRDSRGQTAATASRSTLIRSLETVARAANGLQPIQDAPPSTIVLYATASRDTAFDGEGRNGPLTKHVLRHIGTRGVPVEEFLKRVTQGVETETARDYGRRQTPYTYGSFGGTFCFAGCPGAGEIPPSF